MLFEIYLLGINLCPSRKTIDSNTFEELKEVMKGLK